MALATAVLTVGSVVGIDCSADDTCASALSVVWALLWASAALALVLVAACESELIAGRLWDAGPWAIPTPRSS